MKCIILAGGFATRLWPLTENKAKPLLHLKDRPIISHIVDQIPSEIPIIVSTNAIFEEAFKKWAAYYQNRDLKIFVEDSKSDAGKKGALGATALAIQHEKIDDDLMLIAGDNYFGFSMQKFIESFKGRPILAAYDIKDKSKARRFGVVVMQGGSVIGFQEKPEDPQSTLVSTGCYLFPKKNLKDIADFAQKKNDDLGGIFEYLLQKGETIDVFRFEEAWHDIGSFDAYMQANLELIGNEVITPQGIFPSGPQINPATQNQFLGAVYLGENVMVEKSIIENSLILSGCKIHDCVIRNCIIDENCNLKGVDLSHKMLKASSRIQK